MTNIELRYVYLCHLSEGLRLSMVGRRDDAAIAFARAELASWTLGRRTEG